MADAHLLNGANRFDVDLVVVQKLLDRTLVAVARHHVDVACSTRVGGHGQGTRVRWCTTMQKTPPSPHTHTHPDRQNGRALVLQQINQTPTSTHAAPVRNGAGPSHRAHAVASRTAPRTVFADHRCQVRVNRVGPFERVAAAFGARLVRATPIKVGNGAGRQRDRGTA